MRVLILSACLWGLSPGAAAAQSLQEQYNAAQAAFEQKDFAKAAAGFEQIVARYGKAQGPVNRTAALIYARLGIAKKMLGETEAAAAAFEKALPGLTAEADKVDRYDVLMELGSSRELLLDFAAARDAYTTLLKETGGKPDAINLTALRLALARVSLFDDPAAARQHLESVLPQAVAALTDKKDLLGELYSLRGRIELMAGDYLAANDWFNKALKAAGGLSLKVSQSDVRIRGDLALAAYLLNRKEKMREYLAYTGAGRMSGDDLESGGDMPLPPCAPVSGIQPNDVAVVEFAISDDGQVRNVRPIYASRTGPVALEFARAVAGWSWTPTEAVKFSAFWRSNIRLELRCTKDPERISVVQPFHLAFSKWLESRGVTTNTLPAEARSDAAAAGLLRAELAKREAVAGKNDISLLPILFQLTVNGAVSHTETHDYVLRADAIAAASNAPADVRTLLRFYSILTKPDFFGSAYRRNVIKALTGYLAELSQRGEADTLGAAWMRTEIGLGHLGLKNKSAASAQFEAVVAMPHTILSQTDPIRQLAVLQLASLEAAEKRYDQADALVQAAGISPEQCALLNVQPMAASESIRFPWDALKYSFDGWVKVSYDIDTEGQVVEPRTVIAFPPFVFSDTTEKAVGKFRYHPIRHAGKNIGCTGYSRSINFTLRE